jgi:L-asparaginase
MSDKKDRPTLLAVFTGGTISCTLDPATNLPSPTLSGQEILAMAPQIGEFADVIVDDFGKFPGPQMYPSRVLSLAGRISAAAEGGVVDGVIVTHGTDTMEETAFLLDRLLDLDVPVVMLGSMKLASDPCRDGPANILAACQVAGHPEARGRGVVVVMSDSIHAADHVVKVHAESLDAFASPETGPLGVVDRGQVIFFSPPHPSCLPRLAIERLEARVDLIRAYPGADGRFVEASIGAGAQGLVVEGLGRGNLTPELAAAVIDAAAQIPVVLTTRCLQGRAAPMYGYEGGAAHLRTGGVIFADFLAGNKARLLLMMLLENGANRAAIREVFEAGHYE